MDDESKSSAEAENVEHANRLRTIRNIAVGLDMVRHNVGITRHGFGYKSDEDREVTLSISRKLAVVVDDLNRLTKEGGVGQLGIEALDILENAESRLKNIKVKRGPDDGRRGNHGFDKAFFRENVTELSNTINLLTTSGLLTTLRPEAARVSAVSPEKFREQPETERVPS